MNGRRPAAWSQGRACLEGTLRRAFWAPALVLLFWAVAAKGFDAYVLHPWLDMPTHFAGGVAIAYFVDTAVSQLERVLGPIHRVFRLTLSFAVTGIAAIWWEFLEFVSDVTLGTKMNLGVTDTLSDLLFGLLGGSGFVALVLWRRPAVAADIH